MADEVKAVPDGYHSVTPWVLVNGAVEAIEFYKKAFGATELSRMATPDGKIGHAEVQIGDSRVKISDEYPEMDFVGPQTIGGTSVTLHLYVEDVDEVAKNALAAGAKEIRPVRDEWYGDRSGMFLDPFEHRWNISSRKENLTMEELRKRAKAASMG